MAKCPFCVDIVLEERPGRGFVTWECPVCGCRVLPNPEGDEAWQIWRDEQAYKYLMSKRGGGSSATGNSRMKRKKKIDRVPTRFME